MQAKKKRELYKDELREIIDLSLWVGQLLLQSGAESARVEEAVHKLGTGLGCDWLDVQVSQTAIVVTTTSGLEFRTKMRRIARFGGVNMLRLAEVSDLSYQVMAGKLNRHQLRERLEAIDQEGHLYPAWLVVLLVGLACAAFSRLFGGDLPVFVVSFVAASVGMFVRQQLVRRDLNFLLVVFVAATTAGFIASLGVLFSWGAQPSIALVASVLFLVPGAPLINSVKDLLQFHILTGVTRGVIGLMISLAIAGGLGLTIGVFGLDNPWPAFSGLPTVWEDALWAAVAALGFAVLFNIPPRLLVWCALCGAVGHGLRYVLMTYSPGRLQSIELATLMGATAVGLLGTFFARRFQTPSILFSISGVIPMVPGTFAFGTMLGILEIAGVVPPESGIVTLLAGTGVDGVKTGLLLAALALGIALPSLLFRRQRPVV